MTDGLVNTINGGRNMKKTYDIRMEISIDVPDDASDSDIEDYIAFELGAKSSLSINNTIYNSYENEIDVKFFNIQET